MYRAVLDTCALVPGRQRDFLLQLATEEAYMPLWGSGILFELDYVLARLDAKRGRDGSEERRSHLFEQMGRAFPGAEINAPKDREYDYGLDDADDGHVTHTAILGKADAIVTDDSRAEGPRQPIPSLRRVRIALVVLEVCPIRGNRSRSATVQRRG
jgi:hypothetical protein